MVPSHDLTAWHEAALRIPADDYRAWALARLKPLLTFDRAAWVLTPMGEHGQPMVRAFDCHLWPEGAQRLDLADGWLDRLMRAAHPHAGRALRLSTDREVAEPAAPPQGRTPRPDVLCIAVAERRGSALQFIALVRQATPDRFEEHERPLFQRVVPHLMQGFATAQAVFAAEHGRAWQPPAQPSGRGDPVATASR